MLQKNCTQKYKEFLDPFLTGNNFAFCNWDPTADTLDLAVPELKKLISDKSEWRAVVVLDGENYGFDNINKRNPFNYIDSKTALRELHTAAEIHEFRKESAEALGKAITNPLTKLSMWLAGAPSSEYPAAPVEYRTLPSIDDELYFDELRSRNLKAMEVELDILTEQKGRLLSENFILEGQVQKKPAQIVALCERRRINDNEDCNRAWDIDQEHAYSRFSEENLYSDRMRFLVSDVEYISDQRVESSYFNFLSLVLMLADNGSVGESVRGGRLYSIGIQVDRKRISECYYAYLGKLRATLQKIKSLRRKSLSKKDEPISNREADELFISDVYVPVEIPSEFDRRELYCDYNKIGLSRDCPRDEYDYWDEQYRVIEKKFIRYLREPRRALKASVNEDFRLQNEIDDERAASLNETQLEEVAIRLNDEEEAMVKTKTIQLFKTKEYTTAMENADRNIKKGIAQRMTKKKTWIVGLIAAAAYLFGFLPLLFGNANTGKSFTFSLTITGIVMALFLAVGLVYLFILRHRLKNRFKHFNYVMGGALLEIDRGLEKFSEYLSHSCNVMREFSVLKWMNTENRKHLSVLKKHEHYVMKQLDKAQTVFAGSICVETASVAPSEPFGHDFTKDVIYDYDFGTVIKPGTATFLHPDNVVNTPVDYIESVMLRREELYD